VESPRLQAGPAERGGDVRRLAGSNIATVTAPPPAVQHREALLHATALRPYQAATVDHLRHVFAGGARAPLLVAPTGAGKAVMFTRIASEAVRRGRRVLILVHRRELVRQASATLRDADVAHGIVAPGHAVTDDPVQVASVQTLARRLSDPRYAAPDLIVLDEAHHAVAGQWARVAAAYPKAKLLGVTATPGGAA
jgi:superfamily II DNA or RNA helicase